MSANESSAMLHIAVADIPGYLKESEVYKAFLANDAEDNDTLEIPHDCMVFQPNALSATELETLLKTLRFWVVDPIPEEIMCILFTCASADEFSDVLTRYAHDLPYLDALRAVAQADDKMKVAFARGNVRVVQYLHSQLGLSIDGEAVKLAVEHGHLVCLAYACNNGFLFDESIEYTLIAAQAGHRNCLQYLHEHGAEWKAKVCAAAAYGNQLECLRYAHENGCPWTSNTTLRAAESGSLQCLTYAHEHGCEWARKTCAAAAAGGHLQCLQYAHEHGCGWNGKTTGAAAFCGRLACLRYAHENGCPWSPTTCQAAAEKGHLDCLIYAHRHGCAWDANTCYAAALGGQIYCLQYAHEEGCPWNRYAYRGAEEAGSTECIQHLLRYGCPVPTTGDISWETVDPDSDDEDSV